MIRKALRGMRHAWHKARSLGAAALTRLDLDVAGLWRAIVELRSGPAARLVLTLILVFDGHEQAKAAEP